MQRRPIVPEQAPSRRTAHDRTATVRHHIVPHANGTVSAARHRKPRRATAWSWTRLVSPQAVSIRRVVRIVVACLFVCYLVHTMVVWMPSLVGMELRAAHAPFWTRHQTASFQMHNPRQSRATVEPRPHLLTPRQLQLADEVLDTTVVRYQLPVNETDEHSVWKQGWDLEPNNNLLQPLHIYVVPHSHWDSATRQFSRAESLSRVSRILTTVVTALWRDERRTFVWSDVASLAHWWSQQNTTTHDMVRTLLTHGQLELVHGGWVSSPDEAVTSVYGLTASWNCGHDWIRTHVGALFVPRVSWVLDSYGHSPTLAHLWKQRNGTALFLHRVHYSIKKVLARRRHLEFFWRQTWDTDSGPMDGSPRERTDPWVTDPVNGQRVRPHDIFTHVMPFYSFDIPHTCGPDPKLCCQFDFARRATAPAPVCPWKVAPQPITTQNVAERAHVLLDQYRKKASLYRSSTVLIPLGDEFRYLTSVEAEAQYTNYQMLFDYMNDHLGVRIQFGTLSDYVQAARQTFDGPVPILKGSFFPYADVDHDYFTGFYTSRPLDKALGRQLERVLAAAESMDASALQTNALAEPLQALAMFQEHNAITGTAKSHIMDEYASQLYNAIDTTYDFMLQTLRTSPAQLDQLGVSFDDLVDIRPCWVSLRPRIMSNNLCANEIIVYNPMEEEQWCGETVVPSRRWVNATLPCNDRPGHAPTSRTQFVFDATTGLMIQPIREEWWVWNVEKGGAFIFAGGRPTAFNMSGVNHKVSEDGFVVSTTFWKRTVTEKNVSLWPGGDSVLVLDFVYETDIRPTNHEWVVRFTGEVANEGYFYTDLNGFNVDTHRFRKDMPVQSQVYPMSSMAAIQDDRSRLTVMSDHSHGTASLQDGSIDVWLDRTLDQDDNRGMGTAMNDNRRVRSRLRVVLEREGYDKGTRDTFVTSKIGHRLMNEVQHPLEMFGKLKERNNKTSAFLVDAYRQFEKNLASMNALEEAAKAQRKPAQAKRGLVIRDITTAVHQVSNTVVPFVFMVYKRVDYLRAAIESIRNSDFPRDHVPLIVSHDGHVPEMIDYVNSLKTEFQVQQLFHPHACFDHPDTFPGDDPTLNEGYAGDAYGNPRSSWITCCKHHFTWILKTVFTDETYSTKNVDTFLFLEEDYVVAPTIYQALVNGLNAMDQFAAESRGGFLGLSLDPTGGGAKPVLRNATPNAWNVVPFVSGPMTLHRSSFIQLQNHAAYYCGVDGYDDYNWDFSIMHLNNKFILPHTVLSPTNAQLAKHIGIVGGMHGHKKTKRDPVSTAEFEKLTVAFAGTRVVGSAWINPKPVKKGYGGWGHPADQEHCMRLLSPSNATATKQ